jgi:hypothetical protein
MGRKLNTEEENITSKEKRKIYMREYKRKQYKSKREEITEANKIYYLTKSTDLCLDEINKFTVSKSDFSKALCILRKLDERHPEELKSFLLDFVKTE